MYQIIFNALSASELARLPKSLQLDLLSDFQLLPEDLDSKHQSRFGLIERDGKRLFRCRAGDYRIYFERTPEGVTVHRILHKNTIRDFLFRSKLPMTEEDDVAHVGDFWEMIEEGGRSGRT